MGGRRAFLRGQPGRRPHDAVQLLPEVGRLRLGPVRGVAHAGGQLLRGEPGRDEPSQVPPHRDVDEPGPRPLQGLVEVEHSLDQVLRGQPQPPDDPDRAGARTLHRLPGRALKPLLRHGGGMPRSFTGDIPPARRGQAHLHPAGHLTDRVDVAAGQGPVRVVRPGASEHTGRPAHEVHPAGAGPPRRRDHQPSGGHLSGRSGAGTGRDRPPRTDSRDGRGADEEGPGGRAQLHRQLPAGA